MTYTNTKLWEMIRELRALVKQQIYIINNMKTNVEITYSNAMLWQMIKELRAVVNTQVEVINHQKEEIEQLKGNV